MKNLIKTQLKYFISPLTFVIGILFILFTFANFFIRQQFFNGNSSSLVLFFNAVPYISIIVIPALCWKNSLNTYDDFIPGKRIVKIAARFFSILAVYSVFLFLLFPALIAVALFCSIDFGQIFTSYICLIFYGACVISLCLLLNQLFENSIISFITSTVILAVFNAAHNFSLYFGSSSFLSAIFKQISFAWHFDASSKAIIDSRDFIFFTIVAVVFIIAAAYIQERKAGKKFSKNQKFRISSFVFILILVLLNSSRFYFRLDFSKDKLFSVSKYTKTFLHSIDENVNITFYRSGTLNKLYPQIRDVTDLLQIYASQNKKITFSVKNPDNNKKITDLLENYGIKSQELKTASGTSTEYVNVYSAVVIEYNGAFRAIPFTMTAQTLEYDLDVRLKSLISNKEQTVNIILGNGMDFTNDYSYLVPFLSAQGLNCNPIFIQNSEFTSQLDFASGPLLVLGDSQINIDKAIAIENYILSGKGNGFFAVSPYSVDIAGDWSVTQNKHTNLVEMLENWGIQFENKLCADISCARITMVSGQDDNQLIQQSSYTQVINYPLWIKLLPQINAKQGLTLFWPASIKINDEQLAKPYLQTTNQAYTYEINSNAEKTIETNPFELMNKSTVGFPKQVLTPSVLIEGHLKGLFNLSSVENAKIIAVSDPYFVNTLMTGYNNDGHNADYSNFDFISNSILKLLNEPELAELQGRQIQAYNGFNISDVEVFRNAAFGSIFVLFVIVPVLLVIAAILYFRIKKPKVTYEN